MHHLRPRPLRRAAVKRGGGSRSRRRAAARDLGSRARSPRLARARGGAVAARLRRSHRRARTGRPWLQGVAVLVVVPLLGLLARVRVIGREHVPREGGFIAAPNHPSVLDGFFAALPLLPRRLHFMGMAELWRRPLPAWLISRVGGFPVIRGTWDRDAFETAAAVLARGRVLVVFPEGGVSPPGGYRPAKPGVGHIAHRAGVPILPLHLDGPRRLYRPWTWPRVTVTVGPPLPVLLDEEPSRERSQATADAVLAAIRALAPDAAPEPHLDPDPPETHP